VPDFHHFVAVGASKPLAAPAAEAIAAPAAEDMTPLAATPVAATPVFMGSHQPPVAVLTTHARVTSGGPSSGSPALATVFPPAAEAPVIDPLWEQTVTTASPTSECDSQLDSQDSDPSAIPEHRNRWADLSGETHTCRTPSDDALALAATAPVLDSLGEQGEVI
jgi:hypothetical protein